MVSFLRSGNCWPGISRTGEPTVYRRCRPYTMARGRRREGEQSARTHSISTSVGRSSAEDMAKLNSLSLLSCSGKLYIQLYPSNPSTQTCTGYHAAIVTRCDSRADFGACPCSSYSATTGSLSAPVPAVRSYRGAANYLTCSTSTSFTQSRARRAKKGTRNVSIGHILNYDLIVTKSSF